jgi:hypothetical protein
MWFVVFAAQALVPVVSVDLGLGLTIPADAYSVQGQFGKIS